MVLLLPRLIPILELDLLPGRADDVNRKALSDKVGCSTDGPVGHSGDLVTRGVLRRPIDGISDLDPVERHEGGHHRCGVRESIDVSRHKVRGAARVDRVLHAPPRRECLIGAGSQEHRQPLWRAGNGVVANSRHDPSADARPSAYECHRAEQHADRRVSKLALGYRLGAAHRLGCCFLFSSWLLPPAARQKVAAREQLLQAKERCVAGMSERG